MINILTNSTNNFGLNKNLTNYIVSVLSESNDNNTIINSILSYIGDNFNLDKIILLRSNRELTALNSIYEWHSKTSEPSKIKSCDIRKILYNQ